MQRGRGRMDSEHRGETDEAAVVGANWYRFRPGENLLNSHVMSVSFVWVVRGGGVISAGNRSFRVGPHHIVRLPWHHQVQYRADAQNPFRVGTLHIVPRHAIGVPIEPRVAWLDGDPLLNDPARSGDPKAFAPSMATFASGPARRIADLGTFAVERFTDAPFSEETSRALARLVLLENQLWEDRQANPALPAALEAMMAYARANIGTTLSVSEVAAAGDCSPTTAQRLFNQHTGASLRVWIRQIRLREAAHLLRSSGLRVSEIAEMVGFSDPLYFSRAFRAEHGVPPSQYALGELRP